MTERGGSSGLTVGNARLCILPAPADVADAVARLLADTIRLDPMVVLGLATGATMVPVYRQLVAILRTESIDASRVTTFNLDEYVGLARQHPQSYHTYMARHLFLPGGFSPGRTFVPDGMAADWTAACDAYERAIRATGGIDLQVLGLGPNGHIGFNEPGAAWDTRTHVVDLSSETRRVNARFFRKSGALVPRQAVSMGLGTIMEARRIAVVVFGHGKADILARVITSGPSLHYPATVLVGHPCVTWYVDEAAASRLPKSLRK
ncbi:MAG: glucosamine-6-phosphate deaminase [Clostridia bacterium]